MKQIGNKISLIIYILLIILIMLFMFFIGFRHREDQSLNDFQWLPGGKGLQFNKTSFAYTEKFFSDDFLKGEEFTIELTIKPAFPEIIRFGLILQIFDKTDNSQITIGQWDNSLVILNSNDYSNEQRKPKIYASMLENDRIKSISIISDNFGTKVFIDGELKGFNQNLKMVLPANRNKTNLIIGNSIEGRNPWTGSISHLAINNQLLYTFAEGRGDRVLDKSGNGIDLLLPEKSIILKRSILAIPDIKELGTATMREDMVINFFGFIPLGILLFLAMAKTGIKDSSSILFLTALFSLFFSLSIELTQVIIPTRNSSMLDLFLNTIGGLSGGLIIKKRTFGRRGPRRSPTR